MPIELVIVTPQGESYRGPVESVVLPGSEGEFEVLQSHERFLSPLAIGVVEIKTPGESSFAVIASGFAEVTGEQATVLVESCEIDRDIDRAWAQLELDRARQGLASVGADEKTERIARYEAALQMAEARLDATRRADA